MDLYFSLPVWLESNVREEQSQMYVSETQIQASEAARSSILDETAGKRSLPRGHQGTRSLSCTPFAPFFLFHIFLNT